MAEARMQEARLIEMFNEQVEWNMEECRVLGWTSNARLIQMIERYGDAYKATLKLLDKPSYPGMFTTARNNGWLHLMLESLVADSRYRHLFAKEQIEVAKWRLENED
jgi:hypothetical protein